MKEMIKDCRIKYSWQVVFKPQIEYQSKADTFNMKRKFMRGFISLSNMGANGIVFFQPLYSDPSGFI